MESVLACFKASLVPVNTNYRYVESELYYLWDNADVVGVVFHGAFASRIEPLRDQLPAIQPWGSLELIVSSGVMWSEEVKRGLLRHNSTMVLTDGLGSSESIGMGRSESTGGSATTTASFELGDHACVLREDGGRVEPGTGDIGRIAVRGHLPLGYYKDPDKTAKTFPVIDGVRYAIAGDYAGIRDWVLEQLRR